MNNKKSVTIYDLGAIVERLNALEKNVKDIEKLKDLRVMLAELWLNYAMQLKRLKTLEGNDYRELAIEEKMILSAVSLFLEIRQDLEKR
jgi:hypothetical protein